MAIEVVTSNVSRTRAHKHQTNRHIGRGVRDLIETLEGRLLLSTTWYVATNGGLNSNPGTLAQPFQTIQAAANVAQAGDTVLIEGGVYHETVVPAHSGTPGNPIIYEPYQGQGVEIDGADAITGWTLYNGGANGPIYQAPQPWNLGDGNNQVFANGGTMLTDARWPNTSLDPMLITSASVTSTNAHAATQDTPNSCTIYNAGLTEPAGYWVGATVHISPGQQWVWQTGTVTASAPGSITYSYTQLTSYEVVRAGNPFYLTGKFSQLDSPGETYRDSTTNTLYVWMLDGSAPTSTNVEAKHRQYAFDLSGDSWINIEGVSIHAATINTSATSSHINLMAISGTFISQQMDNPYPWIAKSGPHDTGIIINGTYITVSQCYFVYSSGDGIFLGGSHNTVISNTILDTDYFAGEEAGVSIQGSYNLVAHNNINNTGRSGITFYFTTAVQVMNNVLYNIGLRDTDCGGIYTYGTNATGSRVAYNTIFNLHSGGYGNGGIFLDNNTSNLEIDHNVVFNDDICVKMNGSSINDNFYDNTFAGTLVPGAVTTTIAIGEGATPVTTNCQFQNNIFIGATTFLKGMIQNHNLIFATVAAATPNFVNMSANNYQLAPGSAAIDAGVVISPYTNGFAGAAPDIGAYEYNGPTWYSGGAPVTRSISTQTQAQTDDATQGTNLTPPGIGSADNYDWLEYSAVNLGLTDTKFTANLAVPAAYAGHQIEIHLDSPQGLLVGTLTTTSTGSFTTYATESTSVSNAAIGVHDIYLVFRGGSGVCNLNWFTIT